MSAKSWMLYGANGYTGELIAREAHKRGLRPILAGRNQEAVSALARELGLPFRIFSLESAAFVVENLLNVDLVLHCAGPFSATSAPMVSACLASRTHYLDVTGEVAVFEAIHGQHAKAVNRGVLLLPGVGFDVVPTDCLALNLKKLLPDAHRLVLALHATGKPSRGTAKTMIEGLRTGGRVRENGVLKSVPLGYKVRTFHLDGRPRPATTIPWGDVATAYYTTGIPNIEVYMTLPEKQIRLLKIARALQWLLAGDWVQKRLKARVAAGARGPDASRRAEARSFIYGQVSNPEGQTREAYLTTPNGYDVTVQAALGIVEYLLEFDPPPGFQTPARLLGEHFVRTLPGVALQLPRTRKTVRPRAQSA